MPVSCQCGSHLGPRLQKSLLRKKSPASLAAIVAALTAPAFASSSPVEDSPWRARTSILRFCRNLQIGHTIDALSGWRGPNSTAGGRELFASRSRAAGDSVLVKAEREHNFFCNLGAAFTSSFLGFFSGFQTLLAGLFRTSLGRHHALTSQKSFLFSHP